MKKTILVLHTGGTIAMVEDKSTGSVKPEGDNPLLQFTPQLGENIHLIVKDIFHLPSPHITPTEMCILRNTIEEIVQTQQIDGVVITHGTDTLEETAYFLDLTLNCNIPVVLTGAMRSINEVGSDGLHNFLAAVKVAASDKSKDMGVLVVLNDEIHTAKYVTKTHSSNVATFKSPQFGPVGTVTKRDVYIQQRPIVKEHFHVKEINKQVILLKAYAGMDEMLLEALLQLPVDGIVIEALGQGNLPPKTIKPIQNLLDKHIPIVLVSRCFNGISEPVYAYDGGGKQLEKMGLIFTNGLNGQKARLKLLVALQTTTDIEKIRDFFDQ
ncbi:MAG: asparaginase [Bacillaceae bacterium]